MPLRIVQYEEIPYDLIKHFGSICEVFHHQERFVKSDLQHRAQIFKTVGVKFRCMFLSIKLLE